MVFFALLIDIVCILIFIMLVVSAYKSGFLRSIVLLGGYVLSGFVASATSKTVATFIYNSFISEKITTSVTDALASAVDTSIPVINSIIDSLPSYVSNLLNLDSGIVDKFKNIIESSAQGAGSTIMQTIVSPLVISFLQIICAVVIFLLCSAIISVVALIFSRVYTIPIIGPINSILGGLLGIVQGGVVLVVIAVIGNMIISFTNNNFEYFNNSVVDLTYVYKIFHNLKFI